MRLGPKDSSLVYLLLFVFLWQTIVPAWADSGSSSGSDIPRQVTHTLSDYLWEGPASTLPDETDFGKFSRRVLVSVSGKPFLLSESDIDRIVEDPWTLNESTLAKVKSLPPKFRLKMYSFFSQHMGSVHPEIYGGGQTVTAGQPAPLLITLDDEASKSIISGIGKIFSTHFRTEELIDLGVYILSSEPFFPKNVKQWNRLKSTIVHYDLVLGLVALLSMVALDQGNLRVSRWFYRSPNDSFRLGAYGSVRHLGLSLHPTFAAGLQLAVPNLDVAVGGTEHIRPKVDAEQHSLEVVFREHWLSLLSRAVQWEVSAAARGKVYWRAGDHERFYEASGSFYARKPQIFKDSGIDFLAEGSASTDFLTRAAAEVSAGLEDASTGIVGAFRFSALQEQDKEAEYQASLVFGGVTGDPKKDGYRFLRDANIGLKQAVLDLQEVEKRYCEISKKVSGSILPEDVQLFKMSLNWMDQALSQLETQRANYCSAFLSIDLRIPPSQSGKNDKESKAVNQIAPQQADDSESAAEHKQAVITKEHLFGSLREMCPGLDRINSRTFGPLSKEQMDYIRDRLTPSAYYAVDRECL